MQLAYFVRRGCVGLSLTLSSLTAQPQSPASVTGAPADLAAELANLKGQLAEQRELLNALRREVAAQKAALGAAPVPARQLEAQRGTGVGTAAAEPPARQAAAQPVPEAVGQAPARDGRPPEVAPLFEAPGVLTPKGKYVLEPSYQFGYASSNRVALVGYTIIPALLIGLIDVREVKRNTMTAALAARYGLGSRTEVELRVPYVYRSDSTVSREIFTGTAVENVFHTSGRALGDVELALRHQLNDGGADRSYYVAGLRIKSRTGRDPFEVVTDCVQRCVGPNASGTGLPLDLPTGSGFYGVQPSLTWLFPSDPAIFFGSVRCV